MVRVLSFEAIGTQWTIEISDPPLTQAALARIENKIYRRTSEFDKNYSRFRNDSLVATMAHRAGTYQLPEDARPLFDLYESLYAVSDGAVTPLIGQVLADAGYDAAYSLQPKTLRKPPTWEEALAYHYPRLTLKKPALLDVGAAGKGYLVDIISALLADEGCSAYVVDAAGDMRQVGLASTTVGLEHPAAPDEVIGTITLCNQSLCGSASNRRAWAGLHHIMDPRNLKPVTDIVAVWALADTTLLADAMTTALFFVPAATLKKRYTFEYALVRADGSLEYSKGLTADFF